MNEGSALETLLWVTAVSACAPLLAALTRGLLPQVVVLILGGIVIGPDVLSLGGADELRVLSEVGLGFLFLLAGYEVDPRILHDDATKRATLAWFGSLLLALALVGGLAASGFVHSYVAVSLAMTTTALGILMPLVQERGLTGTAFGRSLIASGAVGELLPVLAIALFLGSRGKIVAILSLTAVALLALVLTYLPRLWHGTALQRLYHANRESTMQVSVRATVLLLVLFLSVAFDFGLDVVLGAFLAGFVLRVLGPDDAESLEVKLDAIGYGFFIPVFFVCSGMQLGLDSILDAPQRLLVFFVLLLVVRAVPTYVAFRTALPGRETVHLALLSATALPLLVAITHIGLETGTMLPANAAALVGAGVLTVLVLPAGVLAADRRAARRQDDPEGDRHP